ncbi:PilN family type IVB pilus formation outer membrane protein [Xanthomonas perforans]|uniref:PilN family type IVB pilus formation outer membrane protein n=1 Tax=Xanthomonas perforans TaxID=442694 RepID=UPI0023592416|nr:PilN family type IVB pilus formation outer membrane protein [Xanthomonas perforans]MDC9654341.1 PilN family type IVB pilus formation outer membrane protein [Xanthomonas perforans]MEB2158978.1 PilN family type IVB pilus formation outer membrane protein [Xanthomonas campestris pv. campestris]
MKNWIIAGLLVGALAGCTATQNMSRSKGDIRNATSEADALLVRARAPAPPLVEGDVLNIRKGETYISTRAKGLATKDGVPASCTIAEGRQGLSLQQFAQLVSNDNSCRIQVRPTADAMRAMEAAQAAGNGNAAAGSDPAAGATMSVQGIPMPAGIALPAPINGANNQASFTGSAANRIDIAYAGSLAGLLDVVTARYGLSWRYTDGAVTIFHVETRFYQIFAIPTTTNVTATTSSGNSISTGTSGGSGVGNSGSSSTSGVSGDTSTKTVTTVGMKTDAMQDLQESIQKMLTPNIGRMALSPSSGMLTVTDTPDVLDTIARFVSAQNDFRTKFVMLNMQVLSVKLSSNDQLGLDWSLVYRNLADQYGINLVSSFAADAEAMSGSINILEGSSRFSGTTAVIRALSEQGDIVNRRNPSTGTLNMEPVSVQVARETAYIASSQGTAAAEVGTTTTLTPGAVTAGFNMNLLPHILPDSETILLQLSLSISDLVQIVRTEKGDAIIESPELDNQVLNQKVKIRSGQTLILSGLETIKVNTNRTGTGSPRWWVFGGGGISKREREVLVLLVTPVVAR